jgi:nucleotide-binding universal stress UspA family protein
MFGQILVPLDGSELSETVFPWARSLAATLQPPPSFLLVRSYEPPSSVYLLPDLSIPTSHALSNEYLGGAILEYLDKAKEALEGLELESKMLIGDTASEVLELSEKADLVLMASHGRGGLGRWLMGSVATKIARGIQVPLMVIGSKVPAPPKNIFIRNILCAVDGSEASERAFELAGRLAAAYQAKLHLYRGVSQVELRDALALKTNQEGVKKALDWVENLAQTAPEGIEVEYKVVETYGRTGIDSYAKEIGANLICMGSHGKGGFERWMLGSETEKVLQTAECPVIVSH